MTRSFFMSRPSLGHEKPDDAVSEELLHGLLPTQGLAIIVSEPGIGKTFLANHLIKCLAAGIRFVHPGSIPEGMPLHLGMPSSQGSSVLLAGEGWDNLHKRAEAAFLSSGDNACLANGLPVVRLKVRGLSKHEHFLQLEQTLWPHLEDLSIFGPLQVLIIDTLSSTLGLDNENDSHECEELVGHLESLGKRLNCLIVLLAHPAKRVKGRPSSIRGSTVWEATPDVIWRLSRLRSKGIKGISLRVTKHRDGGSEGMRFCFSINPLAESAYLEPIDPASHEHMGDRDKAPTHKQRVYATILALYEGGMLPNKKLVIDRLASEGGNKKLDGSVMSEANFRRMVHKAIVELVDSQLVEKSSDGKYLVYTPKAPLNVT